jgi:hypothetical protein
MSVVGAIPGYIWLMFLTPSAGIGIVGVLRRTLVWFVALSFSLTTIGVAIAEGFYTVFIKQQFDEKFRQAPGAGYELSLFGDAAISILGMLLFGATIALLRRNELAPRRWSLCIASLLGAVYSTVPNVFYWSLDEIPIAPFWIFALFFPILAARLTLHRTLAADV